MCKKKFSFFCKAKKVHEGVKRPNVQFLFVKMKTA